MKPGRMRSPVTMKALPDITGINRKCLTGCKAPIPAMAGKISVAADPLRRNDSEASQNTFIFREEGRPSDLS